MRYIHNTDASPLRVLIEPWGQELDLAPGKTFKIVGLGESPGDWEFETQENLVVLYGWPTSTFEVFQEEMLICACPVPVPGIPKGQSVSSFIKGLFGAGSGAGDKK